MKSLLLLSGLIVSLTACVPVNQSLEVHDVVLYGLQERHVFFYGKSGGDGMPARDEIKIGETTIKISSAPAAGKLAIAGAWSVDGKPTLEVKPRLIREVMTLSSLPFTGDLGLATRAGLDKVTYFDGRGWFDLGGPVGSDRKLRVKPTARNGGLRGLGRLTDAEADAIAGYLSSKGPVAVAVLEPASAPDQDLRFEPLPRDYKRTTLYVQVGLQTDLLGGFAEVAPLEVKALASGGNSAHSSENALVRLDADRASLEQTWKLVGGNQVPAPSAPSVDFSRSKVVTVFLGSRPTGGYGIAIADTKLEGKTLVVGVNVREPGAGQISTQAFTSPYASVIVSNAEFSGVRVVNKASGKVLAQAP
jgi:PrcB C-terminal